MWKNMLLTVWKTLLVTTTVIVGLLLLLVLYFRHEDVETSSTSESGDYEIIVTGKEPILLFGPQTVYVYGRHKLWIKPLFGTLVFNDGGRIRKENVVIKWNGNKATIILKGSEQEDEIHQIEFTPQKIKVKNE